MVNPVTETVQFWNNRQSFFGFIRDAQLTTPLFSSFGLSVSRSRIQTRIYYLPFTAYFTLLLDYKQLLGHLR